MYRCRECGRTFEEPDYIEVCFESEAGVSGMFPNHNYGIVTECPYCEAYVDTQEDFDYGEE